MYSLLLAIGLAHYNHLKYNFRTIANRVIFVKTISRKYMKPKSLSAAPPPSPPRGKIMVSLPLIWANRSVHGLGKCYSKFRTSRFHPGIAFTIGTNQFHLPENDRENLKLIYQTWLLKKWNTISVSFGTFCLEKQDFLFRSSVDPKVLR